MQITRVKPALFSSPLVRSWLVAVGIMAVLVCLLLYAGFSLEYAESKGPFKNWTQVVDWDGDGDLDVMVSHTRWEAVDISWAGIGFWVNQGHGTFELVRDRGTGGYPFGGFAAAAVDVDQDRDVDVFTQDFGIHLLVNQGGLQAGELGEYLSLGGINSPPAYNLGYRDMGGTIKLGDLNGDGLIDAFVAGCCYGSNARKSRNDAAYAPSVSWVWINGGRVRNLQTGHILPMDSLDGRPIREAALGDLDGDGDLDIYAAVGKPTLGTVESQDDLLLLNDGTGRLAAYDQPLGDTDSTSVALGDVNGDGRLDALVGTSAGASLWIKQRAELESGTPLFVPAEQSFAAQQTISQRLQAGFSAAAGRLLRLYLPYGSLRTTAVFLADLNEDGSPDALVGRLWEAEVWWNDGQGLFTRSDVHFEYQEDTGLAVADFDGDGDQDIFAAGNGEGYQAWLNDGRGGFSHVRKSRVPGQLP
jgi:hypothetical protein